MSQFVSPLDQMQTQFNVRTAAGSGVQTNMKIRVLHDVHWLSIASSALTHLTSSFYYLFLCTRMLLLVYTGKWTSGSICQSLVGRLIHSPFGRLFMQGGERSMQTKAQKIVQGLPILPLPPREEFSGSVTIGHYASLCNFLSKLLSWVQQKGNDVKETFTFFLTRCHV